VSRHSFESVTAQATQASVQSQTAFMPSLDDLKDGDLFVDFITIDVLERMWQAPLRGSGQPLLMR